MNKTLYKTIEQLEHVLKNLQREGFTHLESTCNQETPAHHDVSPATNPKEHDAMPDSMELIANEIASCERCPLCKGRTQTVPGQGSMQPDVMFIGEGPGAEEDKQGLAFVGRAGKLLTRIIEAMGYTREEVFIGNIVKCRPEGNRTPHPDEMAACMPYLIRQIKLIQPKVIVCLGATAVKGLLQTKEGISKLRGQWSTFEGIDVMPTYHPAYLLRNPNGKKDVWNDMQAVLHHLGKEPPAKSETSSS